MSNIYHEITSYRTKIPKISLPTFLHSTVVLTRLLGLVAWSFCGPPLSWCDHETIPVSCGSLKDRHLGLSIFITTLHQWVYQPRARHLVKSFCCGLWPWSAQGNQCCICLWFEVRVPVLREDGCRGLGLPRTFIRWLRFYVEEEAHVQHLP